MTRSNQKTKWLEQKAFRSRLDTESWFYRVFDGVPTLSFFAKNTKGEIMFASQGLLLRYGFTREDEIIGKTDFELSPSTFAQQYIRDDKLVFSTGQPIKDRLEPWFNARRLPEWHLTSKYPLRDAETGEVIGVMGVVRQIESTDSLPRVAQDIMPAIQYATVHYSDAISVAQMAKLCKCTSRNLQYRFAAVLGMSPQTYVMRVRIDQASLQMRESEKALSDISFDCGFSDQSAFSKKFKELMGITPSAYRRRF